MPYARQSVQPVGMPVFSDIPVQMRCQYCNTNITTYLRHKTGVMTYVVAGFICIMG